MQRGHNTKAEIIRLLEGRRDESLERIHQFILNLDELDYAKFLYPSDSDFVEDLNERVAEAKDMLDKVRDIQITLRDLDLGKIKVQ